MTKNKTIHVKPKVANQTAMNFKINKWHGILGVFAIFLILLMMFAGHSKKHEHKQFNYMRSPKNYQNELQTNLAQLQKMSATINKKFKHYSSLKYNNVTDEKNYIARQNQPTSMYTQMSPYVLSQFNQSKNKLTATAKVVMMQHPQWTIASGELIHAVLETAINSDLPGKVRAVVSQPVYAYVGDRTLIPAGSRLIGEYSAAILQGQNRVFITWRRIILPNGITLNIQSPNADRLGQAGQAADHVNTHFMQRFGQAVLLSILSAGTANYDNNSVDAYHALLQYRFALAQALQQSAQSNLQQMLPIKPSLQINQGAKINIFLTEDLNFYNVLRINS